MSSNEADQSPKPESRPRVIVLGGGFAGIGAAAFAALATGAVLFFRRRFARSLPARHD